MHTHTDTHYNRKTQRSMVHASFKGRIGSCNKVVISSFQISKLSFYDNHELLQLRYGGMWRKYQRKLTTRVFFGTSAEPEGRDTKSGGTTVAENIVYLT